MENATKALLMASGILIGIIILSMGVYLFGIISSYSDFTQEQMEENSINKFNTQFLNYVTEDNEVLSFQDVITVANIAYENNYENNLTLDTFVGDGTTNYVQVVIRGYINPSNNEETNKSYEHLERVVGNAKELSNWLQCNYDSKYTCKEVKISELSKRVYKIVFEKN